MSGRRPVTTATATAAALALADEVLARIGLRDARRKLRPLRTAS